MSMMIQTTFEVGPSGASAGQPQAMSDEQAADGMPSFFEVLAKSLLPETEVASKKVVKVPGAVRDQGRQAADDKADPAALLTGMNLPIVLPESRPHGLMLSGDPSALKDDLTALVAPGLGAQLAELVPAAPPATLKNALAGVGKAPAALVAKELPAGAQLKEALAAMVPVTEGPDTTLPAMPAAVGELTAAVQTLTQNLRRTTTESGQAGVPAAKNAAALQPSDAVAILGKTTPADNRALNTAARGDQPPDAGTSARSGLSAKPGSLSRNADADAMLLPTAAAAKAEVQFMTTLETVAAENSPVVLPNTLGSMVSASLEPAGAGSAAALPVRTFLAPEVGSQGWDKALSQQMANMGKAGHQIAELQLNPPGLGPLKVTLDLNDHQMQLTFVSSHASVRAAVEAAMPQLRATLAENGISLGNTSVSAESQSQTQAGFAQGQGRAPDHRAYPNRSLPDNAAPMAQAVTETRRQSGGLAVDTYA